MGQRRTNGVDRPFQVHVDHLLDVLQRLLAERVVRADARVRDDDVETAETIDGLRDRRLDLPDVPHVAAQPERLGKTEIATAPRGESDLHALGRKQTTHRRADAGARSGDERNLPAEHVPSLLTTGA